MKKVIKKKVESVKPTVTVIKATVEHKPIISKLDIDFGRGDLNLMRDKINELIACQ